MKATPHIRYVRDIGQALVPYAVIACMALGVRALASGGVVEADPEVKAMLTDIARSLTPLEGQVRANSIRIGALEQEYGGKHD